jgi:hypothetical protein
MTGICLLAGMLIAQCGDQVTLSWTHSIEKVVWEEEYRREGTALHLTEARVRGTGAGMEPPEGATLYDGAYHYHPQLPLLAEVQLRHSTFVLPYTVCSDGRCQTLSAWLPGLPEEAVVTLAPCPD